MEKYRPPTPNPLKLSIRVKRDELRIHKAQQLKELQKKNSAFRKLTQAQRDMITYMFVDNQPITNAYCMSHNKKKVSSSVAIKELDKPAVQEAVSEVMDAVGLTTEFLAEAVKDGIGATHTSYDKSTGEKWATDLPDHGTRFQYVKLAWELRGEKPAKSNTSITKNTLNITIEGDDEIEAEFKDVLEKKFNKKDLSDAPRPQPIDAEYE